MRLALIGLVLVAATAVAAAEPIQIVAFGDSMTSGYLLPRDKSYPAQLQAMLRAKGYDVVVRNAGVNGDTTAGALRRFDEAIVPGTRVALVELGLNDRRQRVPATKIEANITEIVRSLRARHIEVMLIGVGSLDLSQVARANQIDYAVWSLPRGKYRARDGAHWSSEGYAVLLKQTLPAIEALIERAKAAR
jgi:acyl-CoA thioesterase-1